MRSWTRVHNWFKVQLEKAWTVGFLLPVKSRDESYIAPMANAAWVSYCPYYTVIYARLLYGARQWNCTRLVCISTPYQNAIITGSSNPWLFCPCHYPAGGRSIWANKSPHLHPSYNPKIYQMQLYHPVKREWNAQTNVYSSCTQSCGKRLFACWLTRTDNWGKLSLAKETISTILKTGHNGWPTGWYRQVFKYVSLIESSILRLS